MGAHGRGGYGLLVADAAVDSQVVPVLQSAIGAARIEDCNGVSAGLRARPLASKRDFYEEHDMGFSGSYKMCIAQDGKVKSVTPVVGIQGVDRCVVDTLKTWQFPKLPLMLCKVQTLRFEVQ